jgi:hypothetical protein
MGSEAPEVPLSRGICGPSGNFAHTSKMSSRKVDDPEEGAGASSGKFAHTSEMSSRRVGDIMQKDTRGLTENALMPPSVPPRGHVALLRRLKLHLPSAS